MAETKDYLKLAVEALEDKKAEDIRIIDISELSDIDDCFIIANGTNRSQVQAMADAVEESLGRAGLSCRSREGYSVARWILMDYTDIVVHLFDRESRGFYDLERIWRDGKMIDPASL